MSGSEHDEDYWEENQQNYFKNLIQNNKNTTLKNPRLILFQILHQKSVSKNIFKTPKIFCFDFSISCCITNPSEVIFWKEVPPKFQFHPAIKNHIQVTPGFKCKVVRIPMWRMEKNKSRST